MMRLKKSGETREHVFLAGTNYSLRLSLGERCLPVLSLILDRLSQCTIRQTGESPEEKRSAHNCMNIHFWQGSAMGLLGS